MLSRTAIKTDCKCFLHNLGVDALSVLREQGDARERGRDESDGSQGTSCSSSNVPACYASTCATTPYELVLLPPGSQLSDADAQRIIALYNQLYLDKYSQR